jgi:hypothetical protein
MELRDLREIHAERPHRCQRRVDDDFLLGSERWLQILPPAAGERFINEFRFVRRRRIDRHRVRTEQRYVDRKFFFWRVRNRLTFAILPQSRMSHQRRPRFRLVSSKIQPQSSPSHWRKRVKSPCVNNSVADRVTDQRTLSNERSCACHCQAKLFFWATVPVETKPRVLSTNIALDDGTASLDLAFEVADYFKLSAKRARAIVGQVGKVVARWGEEAGGLGIRKTDRERMASAFNHNDLQKATHIR